jgi:hypothetical protein
VPEGSRTERSLSLLGSLALTARPRSRRELPGVQRDHDALVVLLMTQSHPLDAGVLVDRLVATLASAALVLASSVAAGL